MKTGKQNNIPLVKYLKLRQLKYWQEIHLLMRDNFMII
jgi:hypothetical protein